MGHKAEGMRVLFRIDEIRRYGNFHPKGRIVFIKQDEEEFSVFVTAAEIEKILREDTTEIREEVRMIRSEKDWSFQEFIQRNNEVDTETGLNKLRRSYGVEPEIPE